MKKSPENSAKTSRRSFNKRIATALVAAPVLSALSSCKQQDTTSRVSTTQNNASPPPTPMPSPPPMLEYPGNPPIIIDDGSFTINLASRLRQDDLGGTRRRYKHTQTDTEEYPRVYGSITLVRLINDYGLKACDDFTVAAGDQMELKMWIQTADGLASNGEVNYSPLTGDDDPDFVLTNGDSGSFEFRYGTEPKDKFDNPKKHYKKKRPHWRYERPDKGSGSNLKYFRVGKVQIKVNSNSCTVGGEATDNKAENGFRVIIILDDAPPPPPPRS